MSLLKGHQRCRRSVAGSPAAKLAAVADWRKSLLFSFWTLRVNTYLASSVRVQTERGQVVVDSGP